MNRFRLAALTITLAAFVAVALVSGDEPKNSAALFGGPLVAGVLMVESGVALGARLAPAMLPGFVAAAVGYLLFVGFGDWGGLNAPGLSVPDLPAYTGVHFGDLGVALAVGVFTTILIFSLKWAAARLEDVGGRRLGMVVLLLAGGLAVGVLAIIENGLGGSSTEAYLTRQGFKPKAFPDINAAIDEL